MSTLLLSGSGFEVRSRFEAAAQDYRAGNYEAAIAALESLIPTLTGQPEQLPALLNLAAAYVAIGNPNAAQTHLQQAELQIQPDTPPRLQAAFYEVRGQAQLSLGHAAQALADGETAAQIFHQLDQPENAQRAQLQQVQALEALGQYRTAMQRLIPLYLQVQAAPDSMVKAQIYRQLAALGQVIGSFDERLNLPTVPPETREDQRIDHLWQAVQLLNAAMAMAERLNAPHLQAEIHLERGNLERASFAWARDAHERVSSFRTDTDRQAAYVQAALEQYQQAAHHSPALQMQAQLNQMSLVVEVLQSAPTLSVPGLDPADLIAPVLQLAATLEAQPPSRDRAFQQLNLAQNLLRYGDLTRQLPQYEDAIADLLTNTLHSVGLTGSPAALCTDLRNKPRDAIAAAYGLLHLGTLYEKQGQWSQAQACTEAAFWLAQPAQHQPLLYQIQWQLGRLLARSPRDRAEAIRAYENAIDTLDQIRADLVSLQQSEFRFSFQDGVEPVYRELIALLLTPEPPTATKQTAKSDPPSQDLERVTDVLGELQVATLEDYLRCNLQGGDQVAAEAIAQTDTTSNTAFIYPILSNNRLEIILKHPKTGLIIRRSSSEITEAQLNDQITEVHKVMKREYSFKETDIYRQLYQQLVEPIAPELAQTGANIIVFGLDRFFQNIPVAILYDGEQYLVESYALAINVGLPLYANSELPTSEQTKLLLTGNSQDFQTGDKPLPAVAKELAQIRDVWPGPVTVLQDQAFTTAAVSDQIRTEPFSIVHLATHGFFSSNPEQTYILTQDQQVNLNAIATLLQHRAASVPEAIQLLVLSACQTATGDRRAALGLAGIAVQTGARSAIASLRPVADGPTADLMTELYTTLQTPNITRAQALQQAQIALLQSPNPQISTPNYWGSFILIGNLQ